MVTYNAHFGKMSEPIATRHEKCARMLIAQPLAASTIFMIQEASATLVRAFLRMSNTHTAYYDPRGAPMAVLTLVPRTLEALEATEAAPRGVMVRIVSFATSPMLRQFHAVFLRNSRIALVNTHLESCADGARTRKEQLGEIGRAVKSEGKNDGEYRFGVFGDLNWPIKTRESRLPRWLTHIPNTLHEANKIDARAYPALSLHHTLTTFLVS